MAFNPGLVPGGEHVVSATPTRLEVANTTGMRSLSLRSALGNDIIYIGMSDMTTSEKRRWYLLAGESLTLQWPSFTPNDVYLFGTAGDIVHWGSEQI